MPPKRASGDAAGGAPAAKRGSGRGSGKQASKEPPIFAGCRVVYWQTKFMQTQQQRVQALGGTLQPALAADTTHVVCAPAMTADEAMRRPDLQAWAG